MAKDKGTNKEKTVSSKALKVKWKKRVGQQEELFKYAVIVVSTVIFFSGY